MSETQPPTVRFVTPMPPSATGIAQYSAELLTAIGDAWDVDVVRDGVPGTSGRRAFGRRRRHLECDAATPTVYQMGNSGYHAQAYECALRAPGVLVLHDVVLHHGRLGEFIRRRRGGDYRALMMQRYGHAGLDVADDMLHGQMAQNFSEFPLCEDFVESARMTVVHSEYARNIVLGCVPDADVTIVPMGVPLPADVDRAVAREAMRLPEQAFVIASITHVNPYKRLDVVLRALRRVAQVVPEAMLVVAGSVAPGVNLQQIASTYGVTRNVVLLGYISDAEARLVAQAADVCVNLRYPSTGETSASLLRLLAAGKPVVITDDAAMAEYPRSATLRVPVDALEVETLAEMLIMLANDSPTRVAAGFNARAFVEREHTMMHAADGYREVLRRAYGLELPAVTAPNQFEPPPDLSVRERTLSLSNIDQSVASALVECGIGDDDVTIDAVARALSDLRLDRMSTEQSECEQVKQQQAIRQELLDILACPVCKLPVRLDGDRLVCDECKRRYRIDDGIPVMLADEAE